MRILFLSHRLPYPPNKGDKIRSFHLLSHLAVRHEVHVACLVDDEKDLEHLPALRRQVAGVEYARIDGLAGKLKRPLALLSAEPVSLRAFHSPALQRRVDELLDHMPFDAVLAFSSPMAEYLFRSRHWPGALRQSRKLMDLIDVDSAKWAEYAARGRWPWSWVYRREARLLADYEARLSRDFDMLFLVSEAECGALPAGLVAEKVMALPNGVDLAYFRSTPAPPTELPRVVFTGVMDYWPNVEGVTWFVREVWPQVRALHPRACFDIVGSRPVRDVRLLAGEPGVRVTGFVPDVREYIGAAQVCVAPLRIARGVQNKVLEAMAMGKPVVCTPQALEGIAAATGRDVLVAADAGSFAGVVNGLLSAPDVAEGIGRAARAYVEQHHRWENTLAPLDSLLA